MNGLMIERENFGVGFYTSFWLKLDVVDIGASLVSILVELVLAIDEVGLCLFCPSSLFGPS